ncbi:MAG: carboxypeptidase regulatory-like domain-containing protein [Flavobacteriales bacterium]
MKHLFLLLCALVSISAIGQESGMRGLVIDENKAPIPFATISLLDPADSTFMHFAMTDEQGLYRFRSISKGEYLLQCAAATYITHYVKIQFPLEGDGNFPAIVMKLAANDLGAVNVEAERIPIRMKGDTLEYNADAFKTKPDASTEDLLKKLPGVQVDDQGNIKANGKTVEKVLVDGKEFFSDDAKVATKNIPADAIEKVQVYEGKGTEAEMTGVDDGTREQTINLTLKDNKKDQWFGEISAGGGTNETFQGNAKVYRFDPTHQFAVLGMVNNINQFGFSYSDYIDFNGGRNNFFQGGGGFSDAPINFGDAIYGINTNGAGGVNFTYEPKKNRRINISYMGNGAEQKLKQTSISQTFLGATDYTTEASSNDNKKTYGHLLSVNSRLRIDSLRSFNGRANVRFSLGKTLGNSVSTLTEESISQILKQNSNSNSDQINISASGSYTRRFSSKKWELVRLRGSYNYKDGQDQNNWTNDQYFALLDSTYYINQFQNNTDRNTTASASATATRNLKNDYRFNTSLSAQINTSEKTRNQNFLIADSDLETISFNPFTRSFNSTSADFSIEKHTKTKHFYFEISNQFSRLSSDSVGNIQARDYYFLVPSLWYGNEYRTGHRLYANYDMSVNAPSASQMFTVLDNSNPQQNSIGERTLRPEQSHNFGISWSLFDQFSFTSLFVGFSGTYTHDKITNARSYNDQLTQIVRPVNVDDDYTSSLSTSFSTPIRKLHTVISLNSDVSASRNIVVLNNQNSISRSLTQTYELSFENDNTDVINLVIGGSISFTDTKNATFNSTNAFTNLNYFANLGIYPTDRFSFDFEADINNYSSQNFQGIIEVPILQASMTYLFGQSNRYGVTLYGYDLLNRNTGVQRSSELNYQSLSTTNIIGQYFMLSFKYRINKVAQADDMQFKMK